MREFDFVILLLIALLLVGGLFFALLRRPPFDLAHENDGSEGERRVADILRSCCRLAEEAVLNNLILFDTNTGRSAQIDHILICERGVFVVETKDYSGMIYGNERQQKWTQVLAYGHRKNKFYSPVKQNATHCFLVQRILKHRFPVYGIVVFVQNNTQHIQSSCVCSAHSLISYIQSHGKHSALLEADMAEAKHLLEQHIQSYPVNAQEHMQHICQLKSTLHENRCPRCGGTLVLRKGKHGTFYGCSNYPNCKFTRQ